MSDITESTPDSSRNVIDDALTAGQALIQNERDSEKLGKDFAVCCVIAIETDHKALLAKCEAEGLKRRNLSKSKHLMEVDFLCGLSNHKDSAAFPPDLYEALGSKVAYCATQVDALRHLVKTQKFKLQNDGTDFDRLSKLRDDHGGVRKMLEIYKSAKTARRKKGSRKTQSNEITSQADILSSVAHSYAARKPRAEVELDTIPGSVGSLGVLLATKTNETTLGVHEMLQIPQSATRTILKQAANLPVSDNPDLNLFFDVLLIGSIALPDGKVGIPTKGAAPGSNTTVSRDYARQYLIRPDADEIWISRRYTDSHLAVRVSGIQSFAGLPSCDAYMFTQHRKHVDGFANRFDRQRMSVETAGAEFDAKWVSKALVKTNGKDADYPIHFHEAENHAVDVKIPVLDDVDWQIFFEVTSEEHYNLLESHITQYEQKRNSIADDSIAMGYKKKKVIFAFSNVGQTEVKATTSLAPQETTYTTMVGEDFVLAWTAINYLDLTCPISIDVDPDGLVRLTAHAVTAKFEFFIPTTGKNSGSKRRDKYYRSAYRLFYADIKSNDAA